MEDISSMILVQEMHGVCGTGLAVSLPLHMLATAVFVRPEDHIILGTIHLYDIGDARQFPRQLPRLIGTMGPESSPPIFCLHMRWTGGGRGGYMAFEDDHGGRDVRFLYVTDCKWNVVHIINVRTQRRMQGCIELPMEHPNGLALKGRLLAVACENGATLQGGICLFQGQATTWECTRIILEQIGTMPRGVRFSSDGTKVVLWSIYAERMSVFHVADGTLAAQVSCTHHTGVMNDVEVMDSGGFLLPADGTALPEVRSVDIVGTLHGKVNVGGSVQNLAWVPDVGLYVRLSECMKLYQTRDQYFKSRMSPARMAWMTAAILATRC